MLLLPLEGEVMDDELLNFKEAAELLRVSDKVLMKLLQEEDVPARKIGKEWRISKLGLYQWIQQGKSRDYAKNASNDAEEE